MSLIERETMRKRIQGSGYADQIKDNMYMMLSLCPAVDANERISRLEAELKDCRNELCYHCGKYTMRHKGACDGCRWTEA